MIAPILSDIWKKKSMTRAYLNAHLRSVRFTGRVLDVGAGKDTSYLSFHPDSNAIERLDVKLGATLDFETDPLPFPDASFDTVLLFNVLEHLFGPSRLLTETNRIVRTNGTLHGFVPFLMRYHADPHDYARYTDEALRKLCTQAGWSNVVVTRVGKGPFIAGLQQIIPFTPRIVRPPLVLLGVLCDMVVLKLRPEARESYPLGYYFTAAKQG